VAESFPYVADIELARLRLDLKNPRLASEPDSQREAFEAMAEAQRGKLLSLCRHLAHNGLSPAQRFIVIPDDENQFIVLDANRRLTALRALEQPELLSGHLLEGEMRQLRQLSDTFEPPEDVACVVFATREDADAWIELLHEGESEGAGLVPWTAQQKTRHRARSGSKPSHLQVLDFVAASGTASDETMRRYARGTYPVSTLERALTTPHVRRQLGIQIVDGEVHTSFPKAEVLKGLTRLVDDIGTGTTKVSEFMTLADRVRYIDRFDEDEMPDPATRLDVTAALDDAPERGRTRGKRAGDKGKSTSRSKLIPSTFSLRIDVPRIHDMYLELKQKLRVDEVPNATGVLLRVFLELSVDEYLSRNSLTPRKDATLARKVTQVVDHLVAEGVLEPKDAIPVREAVKSDDGVNLATNLNALVHNRAMTLSGTDLKALWTRIERLVEKLWA
jgi:hypothetical protein